MGNEEMRRRLNQIAAIFTLVQRVRNDILTVLAESIELRSTRTGRSRSITFHEIREASTANGCVIAAIRRILGFE